MVVVLLGSLSQRLDLAALSRPMNVLELRKLSVGLVTTILLSVGLVTTIWTASNGRGTLSVGPP